MSRTHIERDLERKLRNDIGDVVVTRYCDLCDTVDITGPSMMSSIMVTLTGLLIVTAKTGSLSKEQFLKVMSRQWDIQWFPSDPLSQNRHENEK